MRKRFTKIICACVAAISAMGLVFASGCNDNNGPSVGEVDTTTANVSSNGGFAVQTGDYVYFINGAVTSLGKDTYGDMVKGSIQRISKSDLKSNNYAKTETIVPSVVYSPNSNAGIYIYGDYIYYTTPSTKKDSEGEVQNSTIEFRRTKIDGSDTVKEAYWKTSDTAVNYRYVQVDNVVYIMYVAKETFNGKEVTNLRSVNTSTGLNVLIAYNISGYSFDTENLESPYVYYTMGVTQHLGTNNTVTESYNQLFRARADFVKKVEDKYNLTEIEGYDPNVDPLYVNSGDFVLDGIGIVSNGEGVNTRKSVFNFHYNSNKNYNITNRDYMYDISSYRNGEVLFTRKEGGQETGSLFAVADAAVDTNKDGTVDVGWDAIENNVPSASGIELILDTAESTDYRFIVKEENGVKKRSAVYAGSNGIMYGDFIDGVLKNTFAMTDDGAPNILAIRDEYTLPEGATEGRELHTYLYYSKTGGNGYTFYRIAIDGTRTDYPPNRYSYKDVWLYSGVQILDLDACSNWYMPEFVGNIILFASETEFMSSYNYIMACNLTGGNGSDIMSNKELHDYTEKFNAVTDRIEEYDSDDAVNADGSKAYENLSDALKYAYFTRDGEYLDCLISQYVKIEGRDEEYYYSKTSAQIYRDFVEHSGDWKFYEVDGEKVEYESKKVNDETVYANSRDYYYSMVGKMSESDCEDIVTAYRAKYLKAMPEAELDWWQGLPTAARVWFIIGMCLAGILVIGGCTFAVIYIRVLKRKKAEEEPEGMKVDITDDKDLDVYGDN